MEIKEFIELANSVGFPVITAAALFWLLVNMLNKHGRILTDLKDIIEHNTTVIQDLVKHIERIK